MSTTGTRPPGSMAALTTGMRPRLLRRSMARMAPLPSSGIPGAVMCSLAGSRVRGIRRVRWTARVVRRVCRVRNRALVSLRRGSGLDQVWGAKARPRAGGLARVAGAALHRRGDGLVRAAGRACPAAALVDGGVNGSARQQLNGSLSLKHPAGRSDRRLAR
jgi:hypothetical protein